MQYRSDPSESQKCYAMSISKEAVMYWTLTPGKMLVPYEEKLQRLGLHSFQRRRLRADLITAVKGLFNIDPNLFFLPPAQRGLREHPFKVLQGASHRRRRGSAFSVRVVKYWNELPASVVTASSVNVFKKRLEEVWTKVFPHLPHWLNTHPPPFLLPPPTCTPPINSYHLYMLPNSLLYIGGFFRSVVAYFLPL